MVIYMDMIFFAALNFFILYMFPEFPLFCSLATKESKHSLKNLGAEGCKGTKDPTLASPMRRKPLKQHTNESYLGVSCKRKFIIKSLGVL